MPMNEKTYQAFVGFDGFVDRLARVVLERKGDQVIPFPTITSFANRLIEAAGISADLELQVQESKPGGNAPILAHGLSLLGGNAHCLGNVGAGALHPVFSEWGEKVDFLPLGEPCDALALEFEDGKIMLPDLKFLDQLTWAQVKKCCGEDRLRRLAGKCTLFAMVNWSLLPHAGEIWQGFRDEYLKDGAKGRKVEIFFDLADPSKHPKEKLRECLSLMASFKAIGRVTLGVNENEARRLSAALGCDDPSYEAMGDCLYQSGCAHVILIHPRHGCQAADESGNRFLPGTLAENPVCSTGGGDIFNAGFCHGLQMGLSVDEAVKLAMRCSYLWVTGESPEKANK